MQYITTSTCDIPTAKNISKSDYLVLLNNRDSTAVAINIPDIDTSLADEESSEALNTSDILFPAIRKFQQHLTYDSHGKYLYYVHNMQDVTRKQFGVSASQPDQHHWNIKNLVSLSVDWLANNLYYATSQYIGVSNIGEKRFVFYIHISIYVYFYIIINIQ